MNTALDYEKIATLYDSYCRFTDDIPFFLQICQGSSAVLELTCGTGRLSVPLLQAGVPLTCVDISPAMLAVLRQKLTAARLSAPVVQADITCLPLVPGQSWVLLPFHSFHELPSAAARQQALREAARVLQPDGRLVVTLHNPAVRPRSLQQGPMTYGPFSRLDGEGAVSVTSDLTCVGAGRTVSGWQTVRELDAAGQTIAEHRLAVRFSLIELDPLQALLKSAGFKPEAIFGDYSGSSFEPETSPYIIVDARKEATEATVTSLPPAGRAQDAKHEPQT
ncbi:MAG TPA: class I SAM-dependent methyltransferase [Trichocoleus sp.]